MKRSTDRILVTHVGSLVRPIEIRDVMEAKESGKSYDDATFHSVLKREVANVVRKQAEVGVDIVSDGEFGKVGWFRYLSERLGGLEHRPLRSGEHVPSAFELVREVKVFPEFYEAYAPLQYFDWLPPSQSRTTIGRDAPAMMQTGTPTTMVWDCAGPLSYRGAPMLERDIADFKAALAGVEVEEAFLPVAAPMSARGLWFNSYYKSEEEVLTALADALHEEYKAIVDAGFLLQLDDAFLAHEYDRMSEVSSEAEARKRAELCIELTNHALEGIPPEKVRYHVCWGSWNAPHTTDIPLSTLIGLILKVNAQAYSLEGANPRHEYEFQVWRDVKLPDGKIVIPGVVTHSTNVVEHPETVAMRIENYASVVGKENVIAGTDCGFAQSYNIVRTHESVQWAKLKALAEGAAIASKALWRK